MRLHKAGNVRIRRTAWVTATDAIGTGTTSTTKTMTHNIDGIAPFWPHVEVECYIARTNNKGLATAWVQLDNYQNVAAVSSPPAHAPTWSSGRAISLQATPAFRRFVIPLHVWGTYTVTGATQQIGVKLVCAGTDAETEWAVTGIRSRLLYQE